MEDDPTKRGASGSLANVTALKTFRIQWARGGLYRFAIGPVLSQEVVFQGLFFGIVPIEH